MVQEQSDTSNFARSGPPTITTYHSAYGGTLDGKSFVVANAFTSGWHGSAVSATQMRFPTAPMVEVTLHGRFPKPWGYKIGDAAFDDRFKVSTPDEAFARQLLTPDLRAELLQRDDWAFMFGAYAVLCVCAEPFASVDEIRERLALLDDMEQAVPHELATGVLSKPFTLDDGTRVDLTHPDDVKAALARLSPKEQAELLQRFQETDPTDRMQLIAQFLQHPDHDTH